jgi:hypothetical protein
VERLGGSEPGSTSLNRQQQNSPQILETPQDEDHWYVLVDSQKYGPLRFGHLKELVKQRRLLENDWVWKPGLVSWIAAAEVTDLFADSSQFRDRPQQDNRAAGDQNKARHSKPEFKERAKGQIRDYVLMFLYLWIAFGLLAVHESIVLAQHQINYASHGIAVINALIFAKVMLVAEDLHLGHRLHDKPLVYAIVFKSILFAAALICFHIIEHVIIGMWQGLTIAESIAEVGANKLREIVSFGIIGTVLLAPFFILSEVSRVIGPENFWALFFHRRNA